MKERKGNSASEEENNELSTMYLLSSGHQPQTRTTTTETKNNYMCTPCPAPTPKVKSQGEKKDFLPTDKAKHPNKLLINQRNIKILTLGTGFALKDFGLNIRKTYLRSQRVVICCLQRGFFVVLLQVLHGNRQVGVLSFVILISVIK